MLIFLLHEIQLIQKSFAWQKKVFFRIKREAPKDKRAMANFLINTCIDLLRHLFQNHDFGNVFAGQAKEGVITAGEIK